MITMLNPDAIPEGVLDTAIITETEGLSSYTIMPNVLTKLGTLASSVTLSLNTTSTGTNIVNIYDFIFTTSTTAPNITWPGGISWVEDAAPTINANKTYEVSIMNNLAICGEY